MGNLALSVYETELWEEAKNNIHLLEKDEEQSKDISWQCAQCKWRYPSYFPKCTGKACKDQYNIPKKIPVWNLDFVSLGTFTAENIKKVKEGNHPKFNEYLQYRINYEAAIKEEMQKLKQKYLRLGYFIH